MSTIDTVIIPKKELPKNYSWTGWTLLFIGAVLVVVSYIIDPHRALFNNLIGFTFLVSIAVGGIFFIALEYLAGAVWSTPFRRVTEFIGATLPIAILFAIPLFINIHDLFHWTHADIVQADIVLKHKEPYLNNRFFMIRFVVIMVLWLLFLFLFRRNSMKQDVDNAQKHTRFNIKLAAAFLPIFAISITFFSIDWLMSLEPHWFSTIFGVYFFSGTAICTLSFITYIVVSLSEKGYFFKGITEDHYYSFGALLFALLSFWAYIAFSQFMLIWYANLPEENFWFVERWKNGWEYVSIAIVLFHFWIPYFMLVSRPSKMNPKNLKRTAILLIFAHLIDIYWMVMPSYFDAPVFGYAEIGFPILTLGVVITVFTILGNRKNLVPVGDPKLQQGIDFHL